MDTYSVKLAKMCKIPPIGIKGHEIYPDFTEPENFVKLYELPFEWCYTKYTLAELLSTYYYPITKSRNSFLCALIAFLESISWPEHDWWNMKIALLRKIRRTRWQ